MNDEWRKMKKNFFLKQFMKWLNDERIKMNEGKKKINWFIEWRMKKKWKKKKIKKNNSWSDWMMNE